MKSLAASQAELAARTELAPILLVHLTTYSDYALGTVDAEFWWTRTMPVLYEWGAGAARTFEDAILRLSPIVRRMEHQPNGGLVDLRQTAVELVLSNDLDAAGVSRWQALRAENITFARVEIATLLVPAHRMRLAAPWDLRDLPGTEHVFHFRGELTEIGTVTETEIPLIFEQREPQLDWPFCSVAAECDPKDLGKRYPIPIGRAKSVPCINRKVGWVTTLAQQITTSSYTGNVTVTDATGFPPSGSFEVQIASERVTASFVNATTISISARAQSGTSAVRHNQGETMVEILSSNVLVFSGIEAKALDALYVLSPLTGERVLVDPALYTVTLADTTTDSGRTISTVSFTAANFRTLIDRMAAVSQQAAAIVSVQVPIQAFSVESNPPRVPVSGGITSLDVLRFVGPDAFRINPTSGADEAGKVEWTSDAGLPNPTANVIRWRLVCRLSGSRVNAAQHDIGFRMHLFGVYGSSHPDGGAGELLYTFELTTTEDGVVVASDWDTPPSARTVDDIVGGIIRFYCSNEGGGSTFTGGGFASIWLESSYLEVEIESDLTDLAVAAISLGWGMDFSADVQGAQTGGTLHESPPDVLEWLLEVFAGLGSSAADATTFAAAETNLGANKLAGVLNLAGESFGEIVARLCYEGRCNLVAREESTGTVYRLHAAESDYEWPTAARTLSEFRNQTETEKSAAEQATRFRALYNVDLPPAAEVIGEDHFRGLVRIDLEVNDASALLATANLEAAEDLWGRRDAAVTQLLYVVDEATAENVLAYYAHEAIRRASRIGCTVPWDLGYDLELGDLVAITPRGHAGPLKARVIETVLDLSQPHVGLVLEEVP